MAVSRQLNELVRSGNVSVLVACVYAYCCAICEKVDTVLHEVYLYSP